MKPAAIFCMRTLTRTLTKQFSKNIRRPWNETQADLYVMVHGPADAPFDQDMQDAISEQTRVHGAPLFKVFDLRGKTLIPDMPGVHSQPIARHTTALFAESMGYQHIGYIDDDADFGKEIVESLGVMIGRLQADPGLGCIGPLYGFRLYHQFKKYMDVKHFINVLEGRPWDTCGMQLYNTTPLMTHVKWDIQRQLKWRADPFIFMCMHSNGYKIEEISIPFNHICSKGKAGKKLDPEQRKTQNSHDFQLMVANLPETGTPLKEKPKKPRIMYHRDLINIMRHEERNLNKLLSGEKVARWSNK